MELFCVEICSIVDLLHALMLFTSFNYIFYFQLFFSLSQTSFLLPTLFLPPTFSFTSINFLFTSNFFFTSTNFFFYFQLSFLLPQAFFFIFNFFLLNKIFLLLVCGTYISSIFYSKFATPSFPMLGFTLGPLVGNLKLLPMHHLQKLTILPIQWSKKF